MDESEKNVSKQSVSNSSVSGDLKQQKFNFENVTLNLTIIVHGRDSEVEKKLKREGANDGDDC